MVNRCGMHESCLAFYCHHDLGTLLFIGGGARVVWQVSLSVGPTCSSFLSLPSTLEKSGDLLGTAEGWI